MSDAWPPPTQQLGSLTVDQVFVEYDGPRLFLCSNLTEQLFLFLSIAEDADLSRWLVVPISRRRLALVTANRLDLHSTFGRPEETAFRMDFTEEGNRVTVEPWPVSELTDDVLPDPGVFLDARPEQAPAITTNSAADLAKQLWRHVTTLRLSLPNPLQHDIPIRALSAILAPLQDTLTALHPDYNPQAKSTKGTFPEAIRLSTEINAFAIGVGSVEIYLRSNDQAPMFGEAVLDASARRLRSLVECRADANRLKAVLAEITPKAAHGYTRFLHGLVEAAAGAELQSSSPASTPDPPVKITFEEACAASRILNQLTTPIEEVLEITALLIGGILPKRRFMLVDVQTLHVYRGDVDDGAYQDFHGAELGAEYRCELFGETITKFSTGMEITKWTLLSLKRLDQQAEQIDLPNQTVGQQLPFPGENPE